MAVIRVFFMAAVIAGVVWRKGKAADHRSLNPGRVLMSGGHINNKEGFTVFAASAQFKGSERAVCRNMVERDGSKWSKWRWVKQDTLASGRVHPDKDRRLFLPHAPSPEEVTGRQLCRLVELRHSQVFVDASEDNIHVGAAVEILLPTALLFTYPCLGPGGCAVFEPPEGIRDSHAVDDIDDL